MQTFPVEKAVISIVIGLTILATVLLWKKLPKPVKIWLVIAIVLGVLQVILMILDTAFCYIWDPVGEAYRILIVALFLSTEFLLLYGYRAKLPRHWSFYVALCLTNWMIGHMIW